MRVWRKTVAWLPDPDTLSVLSGALVGLTLGFLGSGGSILALPLLVYFVGYEGAPHVAIGTTALAVSASALANLVQHHRHGAVRLRTGLAFAAPGVLGALLGARLGLATDGTWLLALFALLMLFVAYRMARAKTPALAEGDATEPTPRVAHIALAGAGVGVLAGFFGIGGGFLIVPALVWAARLPMREAVGTSLVAVTAFGLSTAARYGVAGQIDLPVAGLFIAGGIMGALIGTRASHAMPQAALKKAFAATLVVVALFMLAKTMAAIA